VSDPQPAPAEPRREALRRQDRLNGIDYADPGEDRRTLTVTFFHPPPRHLGPQHFRVTGGVRIAAPKVIEVRLHDPADAEQEPFARLVFAHTGDESAYRLALQGVAGFDPRFAAIDFSFAHGADLRPRPQPETDRPGAPPELDYLAKDDAAFRRIAYGRLAQTLPGWTERHAPDVGVMLVEMMAYVGDQLSYYQDAVATEAYLGTARLRTSVRRHARLIDYSMHEGCNARVWLHLATDAKLILQATDIGFSTGAEPAALEYAPVAPGEIRLFPALNAVPFYRWGDGDDRLARGSTSATLRDAWADPSARAGRLLDGLGEGQALLIEPAAGDAAPGGACHVVRLRQVTRGADPLFDVPLVEIAWAAEDALPFDLPLATAVARGNMVLADHGRLIADEIVRERAEAALGPRRPFLRLPDLTFRQAPDEATPASLATRQDPRRARPQLLALSCRADPELALPDDAPVAWSPQPDLIESGADDLHVVVEMDDDGLAGLRFGDGRRGASPGPGPIRASYRIGNGPIGNVAAETIDTVRQRGTVALDGITVRNPLPAVGGIAPEPVAQVKRLAPGVFRARQERAVTGEDYATAAAEVFGVRRAKAELMQIGMTRLARVAILPLAADDPSPDLLDRVRDHLRSRRRIGHDVAVGPARIVALEVALRVGILGDYLRAHVRAALRAVLGAGQRPDGAPGLFHPDGMSFGEPVQCSRIIAAAQGVTGVAWVRLVRLRRLDDPAATDAAASEPTLLLSPFEVARMDDDPAHPEHGRLVITLEGGR
jgi:hypothetical protein